jgi:hypothetical protein
VPNWLAYICYIIIPFLLTGLTLVISKELDASRIATMKSVEASNNDFLANYLAFFFVALSIDNTTTFLFILVLTILFVFFSRVSYFNPILLMFGYNFFYVVTNQDVKILLITKRKLKQPTTQETKVRIINDYTLLELKGDGDIREVKK